MQLFLYYLLIFVIFIEWSWTKGLDEKFTWSRLNYAWPKRTKRQTYLRHYRDNDAIEFPGVTNYGQQHPDSSESPSKSSGPPPGLGFSYIYENNIPMGANLWKNKLFITVPRRRLGVPSTLNYVSLENSNRHNVPLIPYPNWEHNTLKFVSVYRVAVDECDRLWFIDTGTIELPGNITHVKPHTIYVIDLKTDQIVQSYEIPEQDLRPPTILALVTVDVTRASCNDAYAYLPDLAGFGLIVYSFKQQKSWRLSHNYFYLEPENGDFFIAGHRFQWNDGIFSVALTDVRSDGYRDLYFHSMAGLNEYRVSTRILKNETLATRSYHDNDFEIAGRKDRNFQTSASDLHKKTGVLFLGLVNENALACWNTKRNIQDVDLVQKDNDRMIYPSDVKIAGDNVVVLTNTMPGFLYGHLNYEKINFRVWIENVINAIKSTKCDF